MSTAHEDSLATVLFGKVRRSVLALLLGRPDETFYLRQVARIAGGGLGAVQRELRQLAAAGIIERVAQGQHVYYRANRRCPIFPELNKLMIKTSGVADVLRAALLPLAARIDLALIYGSFARGEQRQDSDVDLMIVGDVTMADVVAALGGGAQDQLGREVNPTIYPREEFRQKILSGHHLLGTVLREAKVFLIGDEHELAGLAEERLAEGAQDEQSGDTGHARRSRAAGVRIHSTTLPPRRA